MKPLICSLTAQVPLLALVLFAGDSQAQDPLPVVWSVSERGHGVASITASPDGVFVASGARQDNAIRLRQTSDGSLVRTLIGHTDGVIGLAISPDGTRLASISRDATAKLWRVADGAVLQTMAEVGSFDGPYAGGPVAFSPNGSLLATSLAGTDNLGMWRTTDGSLLHALNANVGGVNAVAFSPDGTLLASAGGFGGADTTIKIWRVADAALVKTIATSSGYSIDQLAFSPDGTVLASGTDRHAHIPGAVELWRSADWTLLHRLPAKGHSLAFSPDGQILLSVRWPQSDTSSVDLWRVTTGLLVKSYLAPAVTYGSISSVIFVSDGRIMLGGLNVVNRTNYVGSVTAVRAPILITDLQRDADQLRVGWSGSGLFQLQIRKNLSDNWADFGEARAEKSISIPMTQPASFFRVIALEQ